MRIGTGSARRARAGAGRRRATPYALDPEHVLRRLAQQSGTYALVNVVAKVSGIALMGLYGNEAVLSQGDFGFLGSLNATMMFALLVAGLGLPLGIIRFASSPSLSGEERAAVPVTALGVALVSAAVLGLAGWVLAPQAAALQFGDPSRADVMRWLVLFIAFKTVSEVSYTVLRQREKAGTFALVGAAEALLLAALVAVFLLRGEGLAGVMKGYALSAAVVAAVVTPLLLMRVDRRARWSLLGPMLAFGMPLIVSGAAGRFLNLGDRYILQYLVGEEAMAPYEWAARFGGVVNTMLAQSFTLAFTVLGLKSADETGSFDLHRSAFRHFSTLAGWVVLGLALFVADVSRLLTDNPAYIETEGLTLLIAAGFAFYGLYFVIVNVLYAAGRTRAVAGAVGAAALLNLALNLVLIPTIGIAGAAVATLVSYVVLSVVTARLGTVSGGGGYPWRALALVSALVVGLWAVAQPTADWPTLGRLAARAALALAYLPGLVVLGVYRREDVDRALALVRRRREHGGSTTGDHPDEPTEAGGPVR